MEITKNEKILVFMIFIMGIIFSSKRWILYLNGLTPFTGFLIYYGIIFISVILLSNLGFSVIPKIKNLTQVIGTILIIFSFFVIVNWESPFVNIVVNGNVNNVSPVYFQAEDGILWTFFYDNMNIKDIENCRILTFIITPTLLTLLGVFLVSKPSLNLF